MKIKTARFEVSAPRLAECPAWRWPEFAFIGRSNVGKSSLINLLCEQRDLARVSDLPGKTQLINFYRVNGDWVLVDLPGYGYAKVGKNQRADFNEAVADYIEERENLAGLFVLIDSRLPPQKIDLEFLKWLEEIEARYTLVFTKSDKQSPTATGRQVAVFMDAVKAWREEPPPHVVTSAKTKAGRRELLEAIAKAITSA